MTFTNIKIALCQIFYLDKFIGNVNDYRIIGVEEAQDFVRLKFEQPGQLDINYSFNPNVATDTTWGTGFIRNFESGGGTYRGLTDCTAVQIEIKGDGSFNTFHFELVETKTDSGDGETWTSPDVSLSSTDWHSMVIPLTHFRRLSDSESRPTIDDYIEGDSRFVHKIARYNVILTGKVRTDTTKFFSLREFKGCDIQSVAPILPVIDDFELNSTTHYPIPFGNALPKIKYNWEIKKSDSTALQVYFNPQRCESPGLSPIGGFLTSLFKAIDISPYDYIQFYLKGDGTNNTARLQLVKKFETSSIEIFESAHVSLQDTNWRLIQLPFFCFSNFDSSNENSLQSSLIGYNFVFSGRDATDETKDFIFIDALQLGTGDVPSQKIVLPMIDSFEYDAFCSFKKCGFCFLDWTTSPIATEGKSSFAITYQFTPNDSIQNNWGAGLIRIFPEVIDLRGYTNIEFDLHGDGSSDSVRLELVESTTAPADGETWASEFFTLYRDKWRHIVLNLDGDFHQLFDRTDNICPGYMDGNRIRDHQFREYHLIFVGHDLQKKNNPVIIDNLHVTGKPPIEQSSYFESFLITEPRFSPYRSELIFEYKLKKPATVIIKIYRLTGELVAEISSGSIQSDTEKHVLSWNGKNINGLDLPNGLYLVKVKIKENDGTEQDGLSHLKFIEICK